MRSKRKVNSEQSIALDWVKRDKDPDGYAVQHYDYKGRGIKTLIKRKKGDFLLHYSGETVSEDEGQSREEAGSSGYRFFYKFEGSAFCVDATEESGRLGRLVNHGSKKERNASMKQLNGYLVLFALRDISEGAELLYDYGVKDLPWLKRKLDNGEDHVKSKVSVSQVSSSGDQGKESESSPLIDFPCSIESLSKEGQIGTVSNTFNSSVSEKELDQMSSEVGVSNEEEVMVGMENVNIEPEQCKECQKANELEIDAEQIVDFDQFPVIEQKELTNDEVYYKVIVQEYIGDDEQCETTTESELESTKEKTSCAAGKTCDEMIGSSENIFNADLDLSYDISNLETQMKCEESQQHEYVSTSTESYDVKEDVEKGNTEKDKTGNNYVQNKQDASSTKTSKVKRIKDKSTGEDHVKSKVNVSQVSSSGDQGKESEPSPLIDFPSSIESLSKEGQIGTVSNTFNSSVSEKELDQMSSEVGVSNEEEVMVGMENVNIEPEQCKECHQANEIENGAEQIVDFDQFPVIEQKELTNDEVYYMGQENIGDYKQCEITTESELESTKEKTSCAAGKTCDEMKGIAHVAVVNPLTNNVVVKPVTQNEDLDLDSDIDSVVYSSGSEYKPDSADSDVTCSDYDSDDNLSVIIPTQVNQRCISGSDEGEEKMNSDTEQLEENDMTPQAHFDECSERSKFKQGQKKGCFKDIEVQTYEKNNGKRNYQRKDYCCFCKQCFKSKISKHLIAMHSQEKPVFDALQLPLKSYQRKMAFQKLQREGNYIHNLEVLRKGSGILIVYRRPSGVTCPSNFLPCEFCFGFFHEKQLWKHAQSCYFRTTSVDDPKNYVRNARVMIHPSVRDENEGDILNNVLEKMRETNKNPGLKEICENDELIREFGMCLLEKLGTTEEQRYKDEDNVRTKLRSVARLLKKLNESRCLPLPMSHFITAPHFRLVVKGVKELFRESDSPQLAKTLGHYIKQISLLKASLALEQENPRNRKEAQEFNEMYQAHWNSKVAAVANRTQRLRTINKQAEIPATSDLLLLKDYVQDEICTYMETKNPTYNNYVKFAYFLIVRITVFNKRRISEVSELKVEDFEAKIGKEEFENMPELSQTLGVTEKTLLSRMHLMEVRGKSTRKVRKVFVLLSQDMIDGINHMLSTRAYAGVDPKNKYLFSNSCDSPLDGCTAMRTITESCPGLNKAHLIRSRLLRKYLATTSQIMDMSGDELKLVADHMGHSVSIHTDIYRLQSSLLERTKVARALVALEEGKLGNFRGMSLSSIDISELPEPVLTDNDDIQDFSSDEENIDDHAVQMPDSSAADQDRSFISKGIKRKRWSPEEIEALKQAFGEQISNKQNVPTEEIRNAKKRFKILNDRSEAMIRTKINNIKLGKEKFH